MEVVFLISIKGSLSRTIRSANFPGSILPNSVWRPITSLEPMIAGVDLTGVPGISTNTAQTILTEVGPNVSLDSEMPQPSHPGLVPHPKSKSAAAKPMNWSSHVLMPGFEELRRQAAQPSSLLFRALCTPLFTGIIGRRPIDARDFAVKTSSLRSRRREAFLTKVCHSVLDGLAPEKVFRDSYCSGYCRSSHCFWIYRIRDSL